MEVREDEVYAVRVNNDNNSDNDNDYKNDNGNDSDNENVNNHNDNDNDNDNEKTSTNEIIDNVMKKEIVDEYGNRISKNELKRRLKAERYVRIKKVLITSLYIILLY